MKLIVVTSQIETRKQEKEFLEFYRNFPLSVSSMELITIEGKKIK